MGEKNGELCGQYVYFDEHQSPVLWRMTDRHITLSECETNGILPHLTAEAAAASTITSSLIMSNKATHRQTAFFLHTSQRNRSLDTLCFLTKCLKNRLRHAHLACDFVLGDEYGKKKKAQRVREQQQTETKEGTLCTTRSLVMVSR